MRPHCEQRTVNWPCSGYAPNLYDGCLHELMGAHRWNYTEGIGWRMAPKSPFGRLNWQQPPPGARVYREVTSIPNPGQAGVGVDTLIVSIRVPPGYDGVLLTITCLWIDAVPATPMTFQNGSGDLTWRVRGNNRWYFKDLGVITTERGDLSQPYPLEGGGYPIQENQTVTMTVSLSAAAPGNLDPNGRILGGLSGWYYPKGGQR